MISRTLSNLWNFVLSVPINLIIVGIVCIFLKIFKRPLKTILRVILTYFISCFILSLLGLSLPSIPAFIKWCKEIIVLLIDQGKSLGL